MKIAEFFVALGVDVDNSKLDEFQGRIQNMQKNLTKVAAVTSLALFAIDRLVDSTVRGAVSLRNFNLQTDLSIQKLQQWHASARLSDISLSFEEITSNVQSLQNRLTQIKLGGGDISGFQLLGIDAMGKDAFEVLEDIRKSIVGLDAATATNMLQRLGLSPQFINVLRLSKEEFDELGSMRFLSKAQRDDVVKLGTEIAKLKIELILFKDRAVAALVPVLSDLVSVIGNVAGFIEVLADSFRYAAEQSLAVRIAISGLLGIVVALALAFWPVTVAVGAVILLMDDLMAFSKGGDSLTGRMIDGVVMLGDKIKSIIIDPVNTFMADLDSKSQGIFGKFGKNINLNPLSGFMGGAASSLVFNNTYHIQSSADSGTVAGSIVDKQQSQFNYSQNHRNNGVVA